MTIKNNYLSSLTPEQREEARKLGQETKKREQEESLSWKHDWLDRPGHAVNPYPTAYVGADMSTQHTPGPWCWFSDNDLWSEKDGEVLGAGDDGKPYGMYSGEIHHHYDPVVKEANKRLIAAAPELLNALHIALEALESISDEMTVGERYTNAGQYLIDALEPSRAAIAKAVRGE